MATAKKHVRENEAYSGYQQAVEEEFGDTLWYFTALCRRLGTGVDTVVSEAVHQDVHEKYIAAIDSPAISYLSPVYESLTLDETLLNLGKASAALFGIENLNEQTRGLLCAFSAWYLRALRAMNLGFVKIVRMNIEKTHGRFLDPDVANLPVFDNEFPNEEKLPHFFKIEITDRKIGQCYLQWNGVFIGDPLTDNILDPDGYRYHDVFHLAHAAILHWSPTFRDLIKQKRKSNPTIDEAEDGGRAIVVEEGLTAWIFSRAKHLNYFEGQNSISFDLLKVVKQFVQGYEVENCPLKLWEEAILKGYEVFRQVRKNNGGIVIGNREARTIKYKPMGEKG
ncbi:MAG: pyrophosphatase [Proteobacteria bacterium]|nr:pyrophosphatase [Pseudomonadota bacterium]